VRSKNSRVSRGSKASYVDESLFGGKHSILMLLGKGKKKSTAGGAAVMSMSEIRKIREKTQSGE